MCFELLSENKVTQFLPRIPLYKERTTCRSLQNASEHHDRKTGAKKISGDFFFHWTPSNLRGSSSSVVSLSLFTLSCVSRPYWSGLPFHPPVGQFVTQSCPALCDPMDYSTPGFPVHHQFLELTQTHVHRIRDAIQPSHLFSSPSPPTLSLAHHQGLFQ